MNNNPSPENFQPMPETPLVPQHPIEPLTPALPTTPTAPEKSPAVVPTKLPRQKVPTWHFLIAMLIQTILIVAVPFRSAVTYATGETITLQTAPVDPYDLLRGYSQTLGFEISDLATLRALPGAESALNKSGSNDYTDSKDFYVVLEAPTGAVSQDAAPIPWEPVAISADYPENLKAGQVALQGQQQWGRAVYGLETYYMPESQRDTINDQIGQARSAENQAFVVDIKVDDKGNSVPLSLWIQNQKLQF
ncbi:MAG: GDYXXLXY domain-containing protein [Cyanobacteria bacterium J06560_2]